MSGPQSRQIPQPPAGHKVLGEQDTVRGLAPEAGIAPSPEPLTRLGNYAVLGVCAVAAYSIFTLVMGLFVLASPSIDGVALLGVLNLLFYPVFALPAILFIAWFYRAYKNLSLLGVERRFSPGKAIAYWLIPLANLVLPGMIGDEIWRAGRRPDRPPRPEGLNLARAWWAVYVGSPLIALIVFNLPLGGERQSTGFWLLSISAGLLVSAGLAIAFLRRAGERLDGLTAHSAPRDGLDRAVSSLYRALPIPVSLTEEDAAERRADPTPVVDAPWATAGGVTFAAAVCSRCGASEMPDANFCGASIGGRP